MAQWSSGRTFSLSICQVISWCQSCFQPEKGGFAWLAVGVLPSLRNSWKVEEVRSKTCSLFCVTFCEESSKARISQRQRSAVSHPSQQSPFTIHLQPQLKNKPRSCHSAIFPPSSVVSVDFPPFLRCAASAPPLSGHGIQHHHSCALRNDYSGSESNDGSISIDAWSAAALTPQTSTNFKMLEEHNCLLHQVRICTVNVPDISWPKPWNKSKLLRFFKLLSC